METDRILCGDALEMLRTLPDNSVHPFLGSGTTAAVARQMGRHYIGIELNPDYCALAEQRIGGAAGSEGAST